MLLKKRLMEMSSWYKILFDFIHESLKYSLLSHKRKELIWIEYMIIKHGRPYWKSNIKIMVNGIDYMALLQNIRYEVCFHTTFGILWFVLCSYVLRQQKKCDK